MGTAQDTNHEARRYSVYYATATEADDFDCVGHSDGPTIAEAITDAWGAPPADGDRAIVIDHYTGVAHPFEAQPPPVPAIKWEAAK